MRKKINIFFTFMLLLRLQDAWAMQENDERKNIFSNKFKLQQIQYEKKYEGPYPEKAYLNQTSL